MNTTTKRFNSTTIRLLYLLLLSLPQILNAQITVDINSGNPNFPFPQFLPYTDGPTHNLGNLGTKNAPGVTHAEMEQTIRDAWQISANKFKYTGKEYKGIKYIQCSLGVGIGYNDCSEGVGYHMIAAALMGDKTTFDGIWFKEHDEKKVLNKKYTDCGQTIRPDYKYGKNTLTDHGQDVATDGTMDMVMGLLLAWKQWGDYSGYDDACGNPISYKQEALDAVRSLVELHKSLDGVTANVFVSGIIGFDGYFKDCNTTSEQTDWANSHDPGPQMKGPSGTEHIDYVSAGYFRAFADFLKKEGGSAEDLSWNIEQLLRAQASTAWINGQLLKNPASIPTAGWVEVKGDKTTFSAYMAGEDWRHPWRCGMDALWHSNPNITWNPKTHQYESTPNSYERDISKRMANFTKDATQAPWGHDCVDARTTAIGLTFYGPSALSDQYDANTGALTGSFPLNWIPGAVSPAAVISQDYDLMGKLYRQCAIVWDAAEPGDGYLTSVPKYFHGWARMLGMLVLSGNHHSPINMRKEANLKIYSKVDKTVAYTGDLVTYTFDYRNYASVNAQNVQIIDTLAAGLEFVSASNEYSISGNIITWNLKSVPGFKTGKINDTKGKITLICKIGESASGRITNRATIKTSNGTGWRTNDYPNEITTTLKRNSVDVEKRALEIEKSADKTKVKPGESVTYTVDFENSSKGGFINGGRPGVVVAYSHEGTQGADQMHTMRFQLFNNAIEPYIDYGNYRVSMFVHSDLTDPWDLNVTNVEGCDQSKFECKVEDIVPGQNTQGKWNKRLIVKFAPQEATITQYLTYYRGNTGINIHRGANAPFRAFCQVNQGWGVGPKWDDDWSWNPGAAGDIQGKYYPVTNDWTDIYNPDEPVTQWLRESCQYTSKTVNNILVEEYDGYTWRRVFGNAPVAGRDIEDVIVKDILPKGFKFLGFIDPSDPTGKKTVNTITVLGATATYDIATHTITWKKDRLLIKEAGQIKYILEAGFKTGKCNGSAEIANNIASIEAKTESAVEAITSVIVYDDNQCPDDNICFLEADKKEPFCEGESVELTASLGDVIAWQDPSGNTIMTTDATGLAIPDKSPEVKTAGTYTVIAANGDELIEHGDFEYPAKLTDAEGKEISDYGYSQYYDNINPGEYRIGTNPNTFNYNMIDVSTTPEFVADGQFMVVDAHGSKQAAVFKAKVKVKKGQRYIFSAKVANVNKAFTNPAELDFVVKGTTIGSNKANSDNYQWSTFSNVWGPATTDETLTIEIKNHTVGDIGNDFALDNISFIGACTDQVDIAIHKKPEIEKLNDLNLCAGSSSKIEPKVTKGDGKITTHIWTDPDKILDDVTIQTPSVLSSAKEQTYKLTYTVEDENGCSAETPVNLTIGGSITPEINGGLDELEICPNATAELDPGEYDTYEWSDKSTNRTLSKLTVGEEYFVTVIDQGGCTGVSNTVKIVLKATSEYKLDQDASVCPLKEVTLDAQDGYSSYSWTLDGKEISNNQTINISKAGTYTSTVSDGCFDDLSAKVVITEVERAEYKLDQDNTICPLKDVSLDAQGGYISYSWALDGKEISTDQVIKITTAGIYTSTVSDGCHDDLSADVTIKEASATDYKLDQDVAICPLKPATLDAQNGYDTYSWTFEGKVISTNQTVEVSKPGIYTSTVGDVCFSNLTSDIVVSDANRPVYELDQDGPVCPYKEISLDAQTGYDAYTWTLNGQVISTDQIVYISKAGIYTATVNDGCFDDLSSDIEITEAEKPDYSLGFNFKVCPNIPLTLDAKAGYESYEWTFNGAIIGSTQYIDITEPGVYHSTVNDGCYPLTDIITVSEREKAIYSLEEDKIKCSHDQVTLDAQDGYIYYKWLFEGEEISTNQIIDVNQKGIYEARVFDGCHELVDYAEVQDLPSPQFKIIDTSEPGIVKMDGFEGKPPYSYTIHNNKEAFDTKSKSFYDLEGGPHTLSIIDENNCVNDTIIYVKFHELKIPNFFTPNGDGVNDIWVIKNLLKYPSAKVTIYDRYGIVIAQFTGEEQGWDGKRNGANAPIDSYWYSISIEEERSSYRGSITLKR